MRHKGRTFGVTDPRVVTVDDAATHVTSGVRGVFAKLPFEQAVLLTRTP